MLLATYKFDFELSARHKRGSALCEHETLHLDQLTCLLTLGIDMGASPKSSPLN